MTTSETCTDMDTVEPTAWLVELIEAGTPASRWALGTEETGVGFFCEDALNAPDTDAGTAPDEDVADWVAECLGVTGVELTETGDGRWSVGITG